MSSSNSDNQAHESNAADDVEDARARLSAKVFTVPRPRKGAIITAYLDPEKQMVWFKISDPRQHEGPSQGIAGYTTITEGDVTEVHRARAGALASNKALLRSKMAEHIFIEACRLRGIDPEDLLPKPFSYFEHEPNRVAKIDESEAQLRYDHFEKERHHKIALVCSQEDHCIIELKRRLHKQRMYNSTLSAGFKTNLEREEAFLRRMQRKRAKYESVLEEENYRILENQSEAMAKLAAMKNRYARIDRMKAALQEVRRSKGKEKQERIAKHVAKQEQLFNEHREALIQARKEKDERVKKHLDSMGKDYTARREHEAKVQAAIEERHEAQKARNAAARQKLVQGLRDKALHIEEQLAAKDERMEQERRLRKIKNENKAMKAARIRKAKLYQRQKIIHKLNDDWARMELIKEFKEAVEEERRNIRRLTKIRNDEWRKNHVVERDITPGAGHYDLKSTLKSDGGTWGKFKPKSEWDWIEHFGKQTPGPADYGRVGTTLKLNGGIISTFMPMSDVDWKIKRAKAIPGPGEYEPRDVSSTAGATFGEFTPKTTIEILQDRAASIPGPGQYDKGMPRARPKLEQLAPIFRVPDKHLEYISDELKKNKLSRSRANSRTKLVGLDVSM